MEINTIQVMASGSGLSALGISWSSFIVQLITFILAMLVLKKWAFTPIVKVLRQRRSIVEDGVKLGEKMRQETVKFEEQIEEKLAAARRQADQIIRDADEHAKNMIKEAETQAKSRADIILSEAEARTKRDLALARNKLEKELVDLVAMATEAILNEKLDAARDNRLIEQTLQDFKTHEALNG